MSNYLEKYYVYGSLRRDGSSKFAPDHRWGTFWSAGLKWDAKKENFLIKSHKESYDSLWDFPFIRHLHGLCTVFARSAFFVSDGVSL